MNQQALKEILDRVYRNDLNPAEALERLKDFPYQNMGFAQVDHHRALRRGFPEALYCEGKTVEQVAAIAGQILSKGSNLLATRASREMYEAVRTLDERAEYHSEARAITVRVTPTRRIKGRVLVITAGTSDIPVAEEAAATAEIMGSTLERLYDVGVAGIHRILDNREALGRARVIVVVAGMDGALASVVAGMVDKPVIAVPTSVGYGANFGGLAPLLTMLNTCASGVATVNIDNGFGAGYMAHLINRSAEPPEATAPSEQSLPNGRRGC